MRARSAYAVGRAGVHQGESSPSRPLGHNHSEIIMIEKAKKFAQRGVVAGALMSGAVAAHAALPTAVTGAFTTVETDVGSMIEAGWPVLVSITVGFVLMTVFKKVVSKAT